MKPPNHIALSSMSLCDLVTTGIITDPCRDPTADTIVVPNVVLSSNERRLILLDAVTSALALIEEMECDFTESQPWNQISSSVDGTQGFSGQ